MSRRYSGRGPNNARPRNRSQRHAHSHSGRGPYKPRHKRQASTAELTASIIVVGVFAIAAVAGRALSGSLTLVLGLCALIVAGAGAVWFWMAFWRGQRFRAVRISGVDKMDGFTFEKYVAELLKHQGFQHVQLTEKYDLGIDAIAERDSERWGIQIKRNRNKTKALSVRQAVTALNHYHCTRAMVVSNNYFTGSARQLAASNRCALIDRDTLSEWILAYQRR